MPFDKQYDARRCGNRLCKRGKVEKRIGRHFDSVGLKAPVTIRLEEHVLPFPRHQYHAARHLSFDDSSDHSGDDLIEFARAHTGLFGRSVRQFGGSRISQWNRREASENANHVGDGTSGLNSTDDHGSCCSLVVFAVAAEPITYCLINTGSNQRCQCSCASILGTDGVSFVSASILILLGRASPAHAGQHQPAVPRHDPGARAEYLPERRRLRDAVFGAVAAILGDDPGRIVPGVEAVKDD